MLMSTIDLYDLETAEDADVEGFTYVKRSVEHGAYFALQMPRADFNEMGAPEVITVTIAAGATVELPEGDDE